MKIEKDGFYFLPLSGTDEIGMNLSLYCYKNRWIIVDCGIAFTDTPGLEVLMPDINKIEQYIPNIEGLVLTHSHEDHYGAIPYLYKHFKLKIPVYCTKFPAELLRAKLKNSRTSVVINEVEVGGCANIGPFSISFIPITHSIPEASLLAIKTDAGTVVHTGDWKLETPLFGHATDEKAIKNLAPVLALMCDSTNVFEPGHSKSEKEVQTGLIEVIENIKDGRIIVACFASNVARLLSCIAAAKKCGRHIAFAGLSLKKISDAAQKCGYFDDLKHVMSVEDAVKLPGEDILFVVTGSQGEPRSALMNILQGSHPFIKISEGDTVIFSSRAIPGNEGVVYRMQNRLTRLGVNVITDSLCDSVIHASGHPNVDELKKMYDMTKPQIAIPVHGTPMHLKRHAEFAREMGVKEVLEPQNGMLIRINPFGVVGQLETGTLALDGSRLIAPDGSVVQERMKMANNGSVFLTVVVSTATRRATDIITLMYGVANGQQDCEFLTKKLRVDLLKDLPLEISQKTEKNLQKEAASIVSKFFNHYIGKKPVLQLHVVYV